MLARGDRLGIFPEGWGHMDGSTREIGEMRRRVPYLAQHSGRRVLPVSLAGSRPLWHGAAAASPTGAACRRAREAVADDVAELSGAEIEANGPCPAP